MSLECDADYALTILGALLHDIGKLRWRGAREEEKKKHRHEFYSKEFVKKLPTPLIKNKTELDMAKLESIVYGHHEEEKDLDLLVSNALKYIKKADRDASSSEREGSLDENPSAPLEAVFKKVCICGRNDHHLDNSVYLPKKLTSDSIFPEREVDQSNMVQASMQLWDELIGECAYLPRDIGSYIETLTALLRKYTSFTLSAGYRSAPVVPLFDHLKLTAAFASALYMSYKKSGMSPVHLEKQYSLIVGDISGIQDFIFNVHSPEKSRKGTAKRLRGRSLEVQLIMEGAARRFLEHYGLPECNLLWCTGGQFTILAPNFAAKDYEALAAELNHELWRRYGNALYLVVGAVECSLETTEDFESVMRSCQEIVGKKKNRRFFEVLEGEHSPLFAESVKEIKGRCPSCGVASEEEGTCEACQEQEKLGEKLANGSYLFICNEHVADFQFAGYSFSILSDKELARSNLLKNTRGVLYRLNDSEFLGYHLGEGIARSFKFIGSTLPKYERKIMSFGMISQLSGGANKLGLAKGDVDNLGFIMHSGVRPVKIWSSTNISSLLDTFFSGYLNKILERYFTYSICDECARKIGKEAYIDVEVESDEEEETRPVRFAKWWLLRDQEKRAEIEAKLCEDCKQSKTSVMYINYSGGDDFLVIGPWDATIEAVVEIRKEFSRFVSDHPDIGLSVGYLSTDNKYPIAIAAKELASRISEAKGYRSRIQADSGSASTYRKDMISIFGDCVHLSATSAKGDGSFSFYELVDFGKELERGINDREIPRGMVHDLIMMWRGSFGRYNEPKELEKARREVRNYMPLLKYKICRNLNGPAKVKYDQAMTDHMPWIIIPASWASLRSRVRRD